MIHRNTQSRRSSVLSGSLSRHPMATQFITNPSAILADLPLDMAGGQSHSADAFVFLLTRVWHSICPGRHLAEQSIFATVASVLTVFSITPRLDEKGAPVPLKVEMTGGAIS